MIKKSTDDFPDEYLTLILMRHAKSDWSDTSLSDHERPLNRRGRKDSTRMADWMIENDLVPDLVLCSTSSRTRATVEIMLDIWDSEPDVVHHENLYLASQDEILREVRTCGVDCDRIMVVAHNPGISHTASMFAEKSIEMPTACVSAFDLATDDWQNAGEEIDRRFRVLMRPKLLSSEP